MTVSLDTAKLHLRVDDAGENTLIQAYLAAAEGHLAGSGVDMTADPLPAAVTAAVLLITGHLYENREASTYDKPIMAIAFGVDRLVAPYREVAA